jgi:anti-sigma regulatory factor (Ser/Thr protein kinase)
MNELSAHLDLPPTVDAPSAARRAAKSMLEAWGLRDESWLATAAVVVSELVTNAVQHGHGTIGLHLHQIGQRVTVSAVDASAAVPRRREPDRSGGRGLAIVQQLSADWGVAGHDSGKRVWAELATYPGDTLARNAHRDNSPTFEQGRSR